MVISFENLFKTRLSITDIVLLLKLYLCQLWCGHGEDYPHLHVYDNEISPVGIIFQDNNSQYFYCNLPIGYRWSYNHKKPDNNGLGCPYQRDHIILNRLKKLYDIIIARNSNPRRQQLSQLLMIFMQKMILSCPLCRNREDDLSIMKEHFKSSVVDIAIRPWYFRYRIPSTKDVVFKNLEIHLKYSDCIFRQIRNDEIKIWLSKQIFIIFSGLVPEATNMLLYEKNRPDVLPFRHYGQQFQKEIFEKVRPGFQFISFKSIKFDEWFESLFRFHVLCEIEVPPNNYRAVLYQLILVIHDFETVLESETSSPVIIIQCQKNGETIEYVLDDENTKQAFIGHCRKYHPFRRGYPALSFLTTA